MATQRYVSTSFWDDGWVSDLKPEEKLIYLYLITNPRTNVAGVYEITKKRIAFDTGYEIEAVEAALTRFEGDGKAHHRLGYIVLPTFPQHQRWQERGKIRQGIVSALQSLPGNIVAFLKTCEYRFDLSAVFPPQDRVSTAGTDGGTTENPKDTLSIPYTYPMDTLSIPHPYPIDRACNYSDSDSDSEFDSESNHDSDSDVQATSVSARKYPRDFEKWWLAYPRKIGKGGAARSWARARLPPLDEHIEIVQRWAATKKWRENNGQFIPNPQTWINQSRWDDELPSENGSVNFDL